MVPPRTEKILTGKVAVITGGSRGLGLAIAMKFIGEGAKVVIASRSPRSVEQAVKMLRANGGQAEGLACDVSKIEEVEALAEHALRTFGQIDIWINNAGLSAPFGPTAQIHSQVVQDLINTNITGTYNGSVVALRKMTRQGHGKLINLLGRGDTGSVPFQNAYSSSKIWVRNFTRALAKEYQGSGIDILGFNPGLVRTEMISQVEAITGMEPKLEALRLVNRVWGNDADVPASKALWLASSATDGRSGLRVTVLTPAFMIGRVLSTGWRWLLRQPLENPALNITSVEPVMELAPVYIKGK
jgi:NAD(P)-dependent dehydrogenase (short-subunit alcohol dehydrogenase family)